MEQRPTCCQNPQRSRLVRGLAFRSWNSVGSWVDMFISSEGFPTRGLPVLFKPIITLSHSEGYTGLSDGDGLLSCGKAARRIPNRASVSCPPRARGLRYRLSWSSTCLPFSAISWHTAFCPIGGQNPCNSIRPTLVLSSPT